MGDGALRPDPVRPLRLRPGGSASERQPVRRTGRRPDGHPPCPGRTSPLAAATPHRPSRRDAGPPPALDPSAGTGDQRLAIDRRRVAIAATARSPARDAPRARPTVLRERVVQDLRAFERKARDAGIAMELLRPAHYALCASIDDVVLNTPWGAASGWASQTLVGTFHPGARGADLFFDQLRQMRRTPNRFLPVIELMYICLALGYMGRYRQVRGEGELDQARDDTHAVIAAQRQAADSELSPHWRGVAAPAQSAPQRLPVWVALAGAVALCGGLFLWTSTTLNAASDDLQSQVLTTPPTRMPQVTRAAIAQPLPPPPVPSEPTVLDRLRASLQPDLDDHAVSLSVPPRHRSSGSLVVRCSHQRAR